MELTNEFCTVIINVDQTYTLYSSDNKHYDYVLNPNNFSGNEEYKTFSICVDLFTREYTIALVGDYNSFDYDCAFLDGYILTVMQNNTISQIDVRNANLLLFKKYECFGCAFAIFRIQNGYIVYGEIEIIRLNENFEKLWSFSGRDIFVSISNKKPFELCEDRIKLYDFEDNYYELNFDGKLIVDTPIKK